MSTPQDPPTRKKQKVRATRKLAEWRKKQAAAAEAAPVAPNKPAKAAAKPAAPAKSA